jgi:transcription elongation factor GreB
MSRAFVKEDSGVPEEPLRRQPSGRPNYVTPAGLARLRAEVERLSALRTQLLSKKKEEEPRALDLQQAEIDLSYFETQVKRAMLVDNRGLAAEDVRFGALVTVKDPEGKLKEYAIVGEDEADAASAKLNWASPLAGALLGKKAGDRAVLPRPGADLDLEVISVRYPEK